MNSFEEIKSEWGKQDEIIVPENSFEALLSKIKNIKKKQKITNVVLAITVFVLIAFFFYISGYKNNQVVLGLSLMIGGLVTRIVIEFLSIRYLKKLNTSKNNAVFKQGLIKYYSQRRIVHLVLTPIIVVLYAIGFIILLPLFKANLTSGFYTYIVVSSIVVLLVLGLFIGKQIKKELKELRVLKDRE
jgi:preprotein translocase subunit Sec61beta